MLILKDEHAIDVLKSGNTGHLWHDFHAIGVHATDVGHPGDDDDDDGSDQGRNQQIAGACRGQSELLQSRGRPGRVGRLALQCTSDESVQMHDIRIMTARNATGSQ